ncbi:MAG: hypothetical protein BWX80_03412 [Candidatus Hydrogenedentes bacterium ADurb.Bin101]|nr:MAG: hypothetical protein BWX80_03412 [Candidatus Hydrogenedentes bacterium ADurb.Bin101]
MNGTLADFLEPVILQGNIIVEVIHRPPAALGQFHQKHSDIGVQLLQLRILEGNDLGHESIQVSESGQLLAKGLPHLFFQLLEPAHRRVYAFIHLAMVCRSLVGFRFVEDLAEFLHFGLVVHLVRIQFRLQFVQLLCFRLFPDGGLFVERLERLPDIVFIVHEIQDKGLFLTVGGAVQTGQGLHRLDARKPLIHIHGMQQRLVKPGLVLLRHQQHLVRIATETLRQFLLPDTLALAVHVHAGFGIFHARHIGVCYRAAECHQRFDARVSLFRDILVKGQFILDGMQTAGSHHHRLCLAANLVHGELPEMLHYHLGLLGNVMGMQAHEPRQGLCRFTLVYLRVVFDGFDQPVVTLVGRIIPEHVQDKPLINGLAHAVQVERLRLAVCAGLAEHLQRLVFRRCGKGEETDIGLLAPFQHRLDNFFLVIGKVIFSTKLCRFLTHIRLREHALHLRSRFTTLRTVRLVNDNRILLLLKSPHLIRCEGELLQGSNDNGHRRSKCLGKLCRVGINLLHHALLMLKLVDGVLELLVEYHPVRDHNHRIVHLLIGSVIQRCEAMGEPGDGVRLAAPGGVLDQVVMAGAVVTGMNYYGTHAIKLVIAREDQGLPLHLLVTQFLLFHLQMNEPRQDIEKTVPCQHLFPEIGGFIPVRIVRIARAAAAAPVEGQEVGMLARQARGHVYLVRIHGKMD